MFHAVANPDLVVVKILPFQCMFRKVEYMKGLQSIFVKIEITETIVLNFIYCVLYTENYGGVTHQGSV